jgi:hypothetical protein
MSDTFEHWRSSYLLEKVTGEEYKSLKEDEGAIVEALEGDNLFEFYIGSKFSSLGYGERNGGTVGIFVGHNEDDAELVLSPRQIRQINEKYGSGAIVFEFHRLLEERLKQIRLQEGPWVKNISG